MIKLQYVLEIRVVYKRCQTVFKLGILGELLASGKSYDKR